MSDTIERTNIAHLAAVAVLPRQKDGWHTDSLPAELVAAAEPAPIVAVLIPCFNEEASVGQVVADFQAALPSATVYVYDNNSTDRTALAARAAGAIVRHEGLQGKGHVVRRMFADIDADAPKTSLVSPPLPGIDSRPGLLNASGSCVPFSSVLRFLVFFLYIFYMVLF